MLRAASEKDVLCVQEHTNGTLYETGIEIMHTNNL